MPCSARARHDLFASWATNPLRKSATSNPAGIPRTGNFSNPPQWAPRVAIAPDRSDFGKWTDVRDFYFGNYDTLVKYASRSHQQEFLLERDDLEPLSAETRDSGNTSPTTRSTGWNSPATRVGTPSEQSHKGIDGLRCDFAQGLPSEFWEYCINKTRSVKWDFLFMAESLDGYREVNGNKRHGVGYRSARHFDILNENIVFYWRDTYFGYPANGPGSAGTPVKTTANTFNAYQPPRGLRGRRPAQQPHLPRRGLSLQRRLRTLQAYAQLSRSMAFRC
jgi:hypothetical protein